MEPPRYRHKTQVISFLQQRFPRRRWEILLPPYGTGHETYFASSSGQSLFIKLGTQAERYQVMADLGLTPRVIATGQLEDGTTLLVQEKVQGKHPARRDFQLHLEKFALCVRKTHQSQAMQRLLPTGPSGAYKDAGLAALIEVENRWKRFEPTVATCSGYVNEKIGYLKDQLNQLAGSGLVASHNDICNGNWLVAGEEIYLLDFDLMSMDDPALDLGAILWWYYPPEMRDKFIEIAGYPNDEAFGTRMRLRMAIHCLNIILPRAGSFDRFSAHSFAGALEDFRAAVEGKENPQGYGD